VVPGRALTAALAVHGLSGNALLTVLLLAGYAVLMLGPIRAGLKRAFSVDTGGVAAVAFTFSGLLFSSAATDSIGMQPVFGAFLFGMVCPAESPSLERNEQNVLDIVEFLLLPFFFLGTRLETNIWQSHIGMAAVGMIALVFVVAVGVKIFGPIVAGRACGYPWPEAVGLGIVLNTRGLTDGGE